MATDIQKFEDGVNAYYAQILALEKSSVDDAMQLLESARAEIVGQLASQSSTGYGTLRLKQLQAIIQQRISQLEAQFDNKIVASLQQAEELGAKLIEAPAMEIGVPVITGVSQDLITAAAAFVADRIKGLGAEAQYQITQILRQMALGTINLREAITRVGRNLDNPSIFRSIASRAETIVRTEVMSIQALSANERMVRNATIMAKAGYVMKKSWLSAEDARVRETHDIADAMYSKGGDPGPIPINQPFIVGGAEMMHPLDPNGPIGEIVNCRCVSRPVVSRA